MHVHSLLQACALCLHPAPSLQSMAAVSSVSYGGGTWRSAKQPAGTTMAQGSVCADVCRPVCPVLQIFESIGPVRELVVLRDRETQESKGSAFVWYATGEDADKVRPGVQAAAEVTVEPGGLSKMPGVACLLGVVAVWMRCC